MKAQGFLLLIWLLLIPLFVTAQYSESLDSDTGYRAMMMQLDSMKRVQANMVTEIESLRGVASSQKEVVDSILSLENKLFELRSAIGALTSKCQAIEQEYIIRDLNRNDEDKAKEVNSVISYVRLVDNKYFRDNLSKDDMDNLLAEADKDALYFSTRDSLYRCVDRLRRIEDLLRVTQCKGVADSLQYIADLELEKINMFEDELGEGWSEMFDLKIYVYNQLLDKLNVSLDVLSELNNKLMDIKRLKGDIADTKLSTLFYIYPQEKELILSYEKMLAEKLAYLPSLDSINERIKKLSGQRFDVNKIAFPKRDFVSMKRATIGGSEVHSSSNPIEGIKLPSYGSIYTIRIYVLTRPLKYITSLKGINTVSLYRSVTGMYEYHTGTYPSWDKAHDDEERIAKLGFKTTIVEWRDGGMVNPEGVVIPVDVYANKYSVVSSSITPELETALKDKFKDKTISVEDGKKVIGYFDNYLEAVAASQIIKDCEIVAVPK